MLFHKVFNETQPKQMNNKNINGVMLAFLIERYVDEINRKGSVPEITSVY